MEKRKEIYFRLLEIAENKGITKNQIGGLIGIAHQTVYAWGDYPPFDRLVELAEALDYDINFLIEKR